MFIWRDIHSYLDRRAKWVVKEIENKSGTDRVTDNKGMENILRKTYNDKYTVQSGEMYEYMESNNT